MNASGILQGILQVSSDYSLPERLFLVSGELILLALLVWLLIRFLRVGAPRVRALLWLLVLAKPILGLAVGTLLPLIQFSPPAVIGDVRIENSGPVDPEAVAARQLETRRALAALGDTSVSVTNGGEDGQPGGAFGARMAKVEEGSGGVLPVRSVLIGLWIIGVVVFTGLALSDRVRIHRLLRATSPPGEDLKARFRELAGVIGLKRVPGLRITDQVESPALVGLLWPVVLLPESLVGHSEPEQLDWLLRHELMHCRLHDPAGLTVRRAAEVLFFFHPVIWWAGRKWEEAMELACDRALLRSETDARTYAKELYRVLENQQLRLRSPVGAGLFATRTQIGQRIEALLSNPLRFRARLTALSVFGVMLVGVIGLTVGVGFSRDSEDVPADSSETISVPDPDDTGGGGVIIVLPDEKPEPSETEDEISLEEREELDSVIGRVQADLRNLAICFETYFIDFNEYPEHLQQLTTPISYMTAVPQDPFAAVVPSDGAVAGATGVEERWLPLRVRFAPDYTEIRLYSVGPDGIDEGGAVRYNPDDGPEGSGDIVRTIELARYYRFEDPALQEKVDEQLARLDSLKSAVNAWFIEHRDVPESLEALAESLPHLDSLSEDLFAPGRRVSYRVDREQGSLTIWSTGPDGDDDGGEKNVQGRFARGQVADGDLVVELELEGLPGRFPEKSDADLLLRDRPDKRALYDMLVGIKEEEGRDNAMIHYILAAGYWPGLPSDTILIEEVLERGWNERANRLLPIIATFQPMFREIRKAVALDYARNIGGEQGPASPIPDYLAAQTSAKMLCVEGRYFESQGKYEEALDNYLAVLTMGRDYASPNSVMIGHLISLAIQNVAFQQITHLASSGNLGAETLGRALTTLKHIESTVNPIANALREEEKTLQWSINDMRKNPEKCREEAEGEAKGWIDDVDQIEADNRDAWEFLIRYAETPEWEWRANDFNRELEERREEYHPLVAIAMPNFVEAKTRFLVTRSRGLETQLATALAASKLEHGQYPQSLDDLTSQYFERLPVDPFSGTEFRYETTGEDFRLWSVGPDGKDDRGQGPPDVPLVYDPTNGTTSEGDVFFR